HRRADATHPVGGDSTDAVLQYRLPVLLSAGPRQQGGRCRGNHDRQCRPRYSAVNNQVEEIMLKPAVFASLLLASLIAIPVASEAHPVALESAPAISNIRPAQGGYWQRCRWLRERIRELEGRECAHAANGSRSEEHTSELQSRRDLVCRLLREKKKIIRYRRISTKFRQL